MGAHKPRTHCFLADTKHLTDVVQDAIERPLEADTGANPAILDIRGSTTMRAPRTRLPAQKTAKAASALQRARQASKTTGAVKVSPTTRRITKDISADRRAAMRELANR